MPLSNMLAISTGDHAVHGGAFRKHYSTYSVNKNIGEIQLPASN